MGYRIRRHKTVKLFDTASIKRVEQTLAGPAIHTQSVKRCERTKVLTVLTTGFDPAAATGGSAAVEVLTPVGASAQTTFVGSEIAKNDHPELTAAFVELGHEIACHGWRWISYQTMGEAQEREHMCIGMEIIEQLTGERARGWYTGRDSPNTRRLVADYGGFEYDSDYYGDDLPFWMQVRRTDGQVVPQLIVPYTLDTNDMRFSSAQGFAQGDDFFTYLRDAFDVLYAEGDPQGLDTPRMLNIGMHCRLLGRPGRFLALQKFLDHIERHDRVWVTRRIDIAEHWAKTHPHQRIERPSQMSHERFVERFGSIFEHSPWIADRAWLALIVCC